MASETHLGDGRYEIRGVLGEGAQGITYDAFDLTEGRAVAIKRFDVRGARSWKDVELAEREARVLATLDHPLMPRYLTHFEENGALYLVMEKVEGETLEAIRQRSGRIPEAEVRRFLASADRALTYLHGRGAPVIHRDIKPRNVIRRADGSYVLVDFGAVAELVLRRGASTVVGTIGYMAPEQFQGRALAATDVYAVGATALAALTGQEPETLAHKGLRVDVHAALDGIASPALIASLEKMLEPDPDLRAKSLESALDGAPAVAPASASLAPVPAAPSSPNAALVVADPDHAWVKSVRGLLWLLWGLGWMIVPLLVKTFGHNDSALIPVIMFTWMAAIFVLTWHKGALLKGLYRAALREQASEREAAGRRAAVPALAEPRARVDVGQQQQQQQVRVHTTELRHEEQVGHTERHDDVAERPRARKVLPGP